jgi:hypothetical protein
MNTVITCYQRHSAGRFVPSFPLRTHDRACKTALATGGTIGFTMGSVEGWIKKALAWQHFFPKA